MVAEGVIGGLEWGGFASELAPTQEREPLTLTLSRKRERGPSGVSHAVVLAG